MQWSPEGPLESTPEPSAGGDVALEPRRRPRGRGLALLAWVVIIGMVGAAAVLRQMTPVAAGGAADEDPIGMLVMRLQSQYIVGAAAFQGDGAVFYGQARGFLDAGTVGQRQRFVVLASELAGVEEAADRLADLDALIDRRAASDEAFELPEERREVQEILRRLFPPDLEPAAAEDPDEILSEDDQSLLRRELGWFGELALAPAGTDDETARAEVLAPAKVVMVALVGTFTALAVVGFIGFVGLVVLFVLALAGRLRSRFAAVGRAPHHGVYAETFAIWMVLFFGCQMAAAVAASLTGGGDMAWAASGFGASLVALAWPVLRGVAWRQVRQEIGWTTGVGLSAEVLAGVGGYFMALPMLAVGVGLTFVLLLVQTAVSGPIDEFAPTGGPAHPIVLDIVGGGWLSRLQILVVASVAAPIVEETMFRGVLYRHLRDASAAMGILASVLFSTLLNAFIFASIHPQGWVAIPALMSLAIAFTVMREWRGTVLPSIIIHAVSNGLVMTLLFVVLSA